MRVAEQKAAQILSWNRLLLAELAEALEERETLEGNELEDMLQSVQVELDVLALMGANGAGSGEPGPGQRAEPVGSVSGAGAGAKEARRGGRR